MNAKYSERGIRRLASAILLQVVYDVEQGQAFSKAVEVLETPLGKSLSNLIDLNAEEIMAKLETGNFIRGRTRAIYR